MAQISVNTIALNVGSIDAIKKEERIFYPELEISGRACYPFLQWSLYLGYWDDAIQDVHITDAAVHSTYGHIVGGRITFDPSKTGEHWILPVLVFTGLSHQFVSNKYIGGYNEFTGKEYFGPTSINSVELGLRVYVNLFRIIQVRAEGRHLFCIYGLSECGGYTVGCDRSIYAAGVAYIF